MKIEPQHAVLDLTTGQPLPTLQFTATNDGAPVTPVWTIDLRRIGQIDPSGLFTPEGTTGGIATITATYSGQTATTHLTVHIVTVQNGDQSAGDPAGAGGAGGVGGEGPGGAVDATLQQVLQSPPTQDPGLQWLYPYDQTVWPLGLLPPLLQWKTGGAGDYDGVYLHVVETNYEYQGFFAKTATPFVHHPIPPSVWQALTWSNGGEPVTISLVFASGGKAYGPLTETWHIAPQTLPGTIYYQSYGTNLVKNYTGTATYNGQSISFGGTTLEIVPGKTSPQLIPGATTDCRGCHSISAQDTILITQRGDNYSASVAYGLAHPTNELPLTPTTGQFLYPALSPDGRLLFSGAVPTQARPALTFGSSAPSGLFELPSGAPVAGVQGLPAGLGGATPAFSPDGKHVAFNFYEGTIGEMAGDVKSLASIDFDNASLTFSNAQVLYTPEKGMAAWPSFLPTSDGVIFELELASNGRDFAGTRSACDDESDPRGCADTGAQAELWWLDLKSHTAHRLDQLNGVGLPTAANGHQNDSELNYEPTVSPIQAGGYAWVVFTSRRLYGNVATLNPYWSDPRYHDLTSSPTPKKLWVAAIDLNAPPGTDPSHPAFYLPGQELLAGNSRGFWGHSDTHASVIAGSTP